MVNDVRVSHGVDVATQADSTSTDPVRPGKQIKWNRITGFPSGFSSKHKKMFVAGGFVDCEVEGRQGDEEPFGRTIVWFDHDGAAVGWHAVDAGPPKGFQRIAFFVMGGPAAPDRSHGSSPKFGKINRLSACWHFLEARFDVGTHLCWLL